jgi:hypothetical protein
MYETCDSAFTALTVDSRYALRHYSTVLSSSTAVRQQYLLQYCSWIRVTVLSIFRELQSNAAVCCDSELIYALAGNTLRKYMQMY